MSEEIPLTEQNALRLKLYELLLKKYAHLINEAERKTIGEIKGLISSDDLTVQSVVSQFKPADFSFERDYLHVAKQLFEFVCKEINYVESKLDINYWLTSKEIMFSKLGDDEDLAVFLCSLLYTLGDQKAYVVVAELNDLSMHALVLTETHGRTYLLDPAQKHSFGEFSGDKKDILLNYNFNGATIKHFLYQFNAKEYRQLI